MKKVKSAKQQQAVWQQQVEQIGEFKDTEMYFICQCMRFKTFECDRIIKSFKTVSDLCQATKKDLNTVNHRLVNVLALLGCIPKPEQDIQCDIFEQTLASLADPPLLTREDWQKYYLDQAFQGENYEHFFHKHGNAVYIIKSEGLDFLNNLNSWSYETLYGLWGIVSAEKLICAISVSDKEKQHLSYLLEVAPEHIDAPPSITHSAS
jgi:hypothetical protein